MSAKDNVENLDEDLILPLTRPIEGPAGPGRAD